MFGVRFNYMNKEKGNLISNIGLIIGWPFFSSVLLFFLFIPIYSLLYLFNTYDIIPHGIVGLLVIVAHIVAFFVSYRITNHTVKGRVSMSAFYAAMIVTILMQIFWRFMMFSWTRFACEDNCVETVLNYDIDLFTVYITIIALLISGAYLNMKIK
jgi:hypothetical protein